MKIKDRRVLRIGSLITIFLLLHGGPKKEKLNKN